MRIAHVSTSISLNQIVLGRMIHLRERGHDVFALCSDDEWAEDIKNAGIEVIDVPFERHKILSSLKAALIMWVICLREEFDVIHTHNALPGAAGRIAGRLAGVRVVVHTWHSWPLYERQNYILSLGLRILEPIAAKIADAVLFLNPEDMEHWGKLRGTNLNKARLIGNGVDAESITSRIGPDSRHTVRNELEIDDDAFVITMVARLEHPRKGHMFFLSGLQRLVKHLDTDVVALLVGIGGDEQLIRAEVLRLGLEKKVRFCGYRDDIPSIFAASDVCALTSPYEGVPRALMESMACGLPVVATDVPGTRFLVQSGQTGILVKFGDVDGLVRVLTKISKNPDWSERLAKRGQSLIKTNFRDADVTDRILQIYKHVINANQEQLPGWNFETEYLARHR